MYFFFVCLHFNWNGWKVVWGLNVVSVLKRIKQKIKAYKLGGYKVMLEDVPPPPESSSIYRKKTSRTPVSHTTGRKNITDVAIPTEPEWRRHLLFVSSEEQECMSQIPTSLAFLCPFQVTWSSYTVTPQHWEQQGEFSTHPKSLVCENPECHSHANQLKAGQGKAHEICESRFAV